MEWKQTDSEVPGQWGLKRAGSRLEGGSTETGSAERRGMDAGVVGFADVGYSVSPFEYGGAATVSLEGLDFQASDFQASDFQASGFEASSCEVSGSEVSGSDAGRREYGAEHSSGHGRGAERPTADDLISHADPKSADSRSIVVYGACDGASSAHDTPAHDTSNDDTSALALRAGRAMSERAATPQCGSQDASTGLSVPQKSGRNRKRRSSALGASGADPRSFRARFATAVADACDLFGARPYQYEMALDCIDHFASHLDAAQQEPSGDRPTEGGTGADASDVATPPSDAIGLEGSDARRSRSVLVQSPTGSGKTFVGLLCAWVLQRELGLRVGWCAGRRELLRQASDENRKFGFGVELACISMFDKQPPKVDLLVIDEAHHDGAMSMATLHGVIDPKFVIGLTATPFRRDRVKLCFEKTIKNCSIQRLVDDGYLSQYEHFTVPDWSPEQVARIFCSEPARWGQSLIFLKTRVEAESCMGVLVAHGIRAELVTGSSDRRRQIAAFRKGEVQVLVSMNVLTEGFDCPSIRTVFARPASRLPTVQMAGRVFRRHADIPVKQVVQAKGSPLPMTRLVRPLVQYVLTETGWRSLGSTRALDHEVEQMRRTLATISVVLPSFISRKRRQRRARMARR